MKNRPSHLASVLAIASVLAVTSVASSAYAEAQAGHPGFRGPLRAADANQDGQITKAEFVAARQARHGQKAADLATTDGPVTGFDRLDANRDGILTAAEVKTYWGPSGLRRVQ